MSDVTVVVASGISRSVMDIMCYNMDISAFLNKKVYVLSPQLLTFNILCAIIYR